MPCPNILDAALTRLDEAARHVQIDSDVLEKLKYPRETMKVRLLIRMDDGLDALNAVKEMMADLGRPHDNLYEVALWEDMLTVQGDELFYAYMVDNQAIVIPETIDAIRALTGLATEAFATMALTDAALGIGALARW